MSSYRLSERADRDLGGIYLCGIEQFGMMQTERYRQELDDCFTLLAGQPRMGRPADTIAPGLRRHEHGSHVILYREEADGILVVAVVHGRGVYGLEL